MGLYFWVWTWNILWRGTGENIGKCRDLVLITVCVCANVHPQTCNRGYTKCGPPLHPLMLTTCLCLLLLLSAQLLTCMCSVCAQYYLCSHQCPFQGGQVSIFCMGGDFSPKHSSFPPKIPNCNIQIFVDKVLTWLPVLLTLIDYHVAISLNVLHIIHTIADKMSP